MQFEHLQLAPQITPALKHSQYFFRHSDFLHLQPVPCTFCTESLAPRRFFTTNLFWNAFEFFKRVSFIALSLTAPASGVFPQSIQLHPEQNRSTAKHSQYNLRHFDFLQLHGLLFGGTFFLPFSFPTEGAIPL